ncbi:hypothetical protein GCM10022415_28600 [Knoellia locipacati]|uniref:Uncharacterized protein n=1 Tax=Knoellia locipacati TaxID=882824 RepID=A0A512T4E4_9MICO|nr:hypothetical protein [Knoellia locipacati]GEQ15098.1 hypothetical protein KLO01_31450 [Knoellia locipacati]
MNLIDRTRIETAVARYDFWLEMRGVRGSRRRDLRRELRANLTEASADVGTTRALFGIGSPKELAYAATDTDPSRPRWSQGLIWGAATLALLVAWLLVTSLTIVQSVEAAGVTRAVDVHPFPWFGTTFTVQSSPGTLQASISPLWQLLAGPLFVFLFVAQPWRLLRRRRPALVHDASSEQSA